MVLNNGTVRASDRARDGQALELWSGTQSRQITTIAKLVAPLFAGAEPTAQTPLTVRGITQTAGLSASPDGAYLGVHLNFLGTAPSSVYFVVRTTDGTATVIGGGASVSDEAWAPTSRYLGYTQTAPTSGAASHAMVRDAQTGDTTMDLAGRFAGWSPDGLWAYIARADGLYARRLAGGDALRFSSIGVVLSATKP